MTQILSFVDTPFTVDCPQVGEDGNWSYTAGLGEWKSWVVLRNGDYLALVDRSTQTTAWCAPMGLGGTTEAPVVTNDSPVGRPEFIPSLEPITLGAAWPNGHEPMLAVAGGRLWVIQEIAVQRPEIHSQQSQFYDAYLGVDDTGATTWLREVPSPKAAEIVASAPLHDAVTGALFLTQEWRDPDVGNEARGMTIDAATGSFGRPWLPPDITATACSSDCWVAVAAGNVVYQTRTGDYFSSDTTYGVAVRTQSGARVAADGPWTRERRAIAGPSHYLLQGVSTSDGSPTNKVASYAYADGKGRTITAPFPIDLSQCVSNGFTVWVCTGRTSDGTEAITAFDEASGKVLWHWKTGDPEATTGVAREVPQQIRAWGDYVYGTNGQGVRYVLDMATGRDTGLETDIDGVSNGYGEISVFGNTITWQQPTS